MEILNWAAPGSVIGSLYATNDRTGVDYDVPLRDSGPFRSMTGVYPWKVAGDYKSVAYVTNITDKSVEFVAEIAFAGGQYTIGPRTLGPRETSVFDIEKLRNGAVKDIAGRTLPMNITHGQFKWAQKGVTNGKVILIGRIEMLSRYNGVSTSYSCPTDCGPTYDATVDFPPEVFVEESGTGTVTETASWNYGYTMGPYPTSASWSVDDSIVDFDPSTASGTTITGITSGTANLSAFVGWWERYDWDGLNCVDLGPVQEGGGGPVDVPPEDLHFTTVTYSSASASFANFGLRDEATLNLSGVGNSANICSGAASFTMDVAFSFPNGGTMKDHDDPSNQIKTGASHQWEWETWSFKNVSGGTGSIDLKIFRRSSNGSFANYVDIILAGNQPSGTTGSFSGRGRVHVVCP